MYYIEVETPKGKWQFWGRLPRCKALGVFVAVYTKMAEPTEMPFGAHLCVPKVKNSFKSIRQHER